MTNVPGYELAKVQIMGKYNFFENSFESVVFFLKRIKKPQKLDLAAKHNKKTFNNFTSCINFS
jgi:hypothetical protein